MNRLSRKPIQTRSYDQRRAGDFRNSRHLPKSNFDFIQLIKFGLIDNEILKNENDLLSGDLIQWADGFVLVYSILDRISFDYIRRFRRHITQYRSTNPTGIRSGDSGSCLTCSFFVVVVEYFV